jgi:hypothetical protein
MGDILVLNISLIDCGFDILEQCSTICSGYLLLFFLCTVVIIPTYQNPHMEFTAQTEIAGRDFSELTVPSTGMRGSITPKDYGLNSS